jgi:hypothetical protein
MESSSSRGGEGWANGPILQTIAAHNTKMKHWTRFNKDAPVAWYSYTYKFFGCSPQIAKLRWWTSRTCESRIAKW